ncbi:hypothetical protein SO694_00082159 [Aureococcus anophagefferens]|uniref:Right handed beta helix domain-containing protein n=2 Tax=Aureococcus anophagefferens TaxID=44056 RepID=A0ABR1FJ79_AURAN
MSGEHGQLLGGLPAPVRRSLLAVLVVAVAVASDACDASVGDAAALAAAVKRAGSDACFCSFDKRPACVGRTSVVAVTADIALAAPVHIPFNASVSLVGPHAISGAGDHGLFVTFGQLALSGLRLADGNAMGTGGAEGCGTIAIFGACGGCVDVKPTGSLAVSDASFERCAANHSGGAIYAYLSEVTLRNVSFARTSAGVGGGAIAIWGGEATIVASTFVGTQSSFTGGALCCAKSNCSVSRSLFRSTSAGEGGGAVAFEGGGSGGYGPAARSLELEDTVFEGTAANHYGGAVLVSGGAVAAVGVTFDRCAAAVGGAVHLESSKGYSGVSPIESDLDLRRCTFSSCRATTGDGGGVNVVSAGRVTLGPGLVFRGNVAETGGGGGAYLRNISESLVVRDAVFAENRCRSRGGGLFVEFQAPKPRVECARCPVEIDPYSRQPCAYAKNGTWRSWDVSSDVAVVGSTFVGNEANFSAGGLGVTGGARMALEDTSFHRNSARISVPRP